MATLRFRPFRNDSQSRWTDLGIIPSAFQVAKIGDFNGDGTSDILWHTNYGDTAISTMLNNSQSQWTDMGMVPTAFSPIKM